MAYKWSRTKAHVCFPPKPGVFLNPHASPHKFTMGGRNTLVCTQLMCAYRGKGRLLYSPSPFKCFLGVLDLGQQPVVRAAESPELFEVY